MKNSIHVKIIRQKTKDCMPSVPDARDYYIGETGIVTSINEERKIVLVTFDDNCQMYFNESEVAYV